MTPLPGYRVRVESDDPANPSAGAAHGPCLYLGPRGQRCDRAALEDGFCALHSPDAVALGPWVWFRRMAALLLLAAILWPLVDALLEELSHWRH